jgi:hypothetical protein
MFLKFFSAKYYPTKTYYKDSWKVRSKSIGIGRSLENGFKHEFITNFLPWDIIPGRNDNSEGKNTQIVKFKQKAG